MKLRKIKIIHILVLILGLIFFLLPAFHTNLWFDETYSVAIANHSFKEIIQIAGNDVHPVLYYILLKILSVIFSNNILVYRIFSVVGMFCFACIGYSHIAKDFSQKTGLIFSIFAIFMPVLSIYAVEIRMYSWVMVTTTLTAIYAYRIINYKSKFKNWLLYTIFSLLSAYLHYYGLLTVAIINIFLLTNMIKENTKEIKKENEKNIKENEKINEKTKEETKQNKGKISLKNYVISSLTQILLYIPWLWYFLRQVKQVSKGFWISIKYPDIFKDIISFQYTGFLNSNFAFIFSIILYIYLLYRFYKNKEKQNSENFKFAKVCIKIYLIVIIIALVLSIKTAIFIPRYLLPMTGLLLLNVSIVFSSEKNKYIIFAFCLVLALMGIKSNIEQVKQNYDKSNRSHIEFLNKNIQKEDILIYTNMTNGGVMAINFPNNYQYFYNKEHWNVQEAYKAYAPQMQCIDSLDSLSGYKGKIWVIDASDKTLYSILDNDKRFIKIAEPKEFVVKYKNQDYLISLFEKDN